jgi:hypothetical protein
MLRKLFVTWLVVAAIPVAAATNDAPARDDSDLAGRYICEGRSPEGRPYHGMVDIVRLDDTFRVIWTLAADSGEVQQVMGVGILSNGVFAASYFGGGPGVAVYRIDGQKLVGQWTIGGADGEMYPETLTRMSEEQQRELQQREQQQEQQQQEQDQDRPAPTRQIPASFRQASR